MSIKLKFTGFDDLLKDIEAAEGSMNKAADSALRQGAQILQSELKSEMASANVPKNLINAMPPFEVESFGNTHVARVGYKKGAYNPDNLSDGYKVVFLNYGTPNRTKHGKIEEGGKIKLGFINRARRKAKPKIKKAQKQALDKILARLKK